MTEKKDEIRLRCPKCQYEWSYTGKLIKATCPSCGNKVDRRKDEVKKK